MKSLSYNRTLRLLGLGVAAFVVAVSGVTPIAFAAPNPESCFTFNGAGTITGYNFAGVGCGANVEIPSSIGGVPVTAIGNQAFLGPAFGPGDKITSLVIPDSVTAIGYEAFRYNALATVVFGNSVTSIDYRAFSDNALVTVTLPDSITTLAQGVFQNNLLENVTLPSNLTSIETSLFANNKITSIVIPDTVTTIGDIAFERNQLTSLNIPDSVISIGAYAFSANKLESVTIGRSVQIIDYEAFSINRLTSVILPDSVTTLDPSTFAVQNPDGGDKYDDFWSFSAATQAVLDTVWYVQLLTEIPTNPRAFTDSMLNEYDYDGGDMTGDGDDTDMVGGHLINAAKSTVTYKNQQGATLSPTVTVTGTGLSSYRAIDNPANDASRYFRLGSQQTFSAPQVAGYSTISPSSPYTTTLTSANTTVNFVYSNPAASSGQGSLSNTGQSLYTFLLIAVGMMLIACGSYWSRIRQIS